MTSPVEKPEQKLMSVDLAQKTVAATDLLDATIAHREGDPSCEC